VTAFRRSVGIALLAVMGAACKDTQPAAAAATSDITAAQVMYSLHQRITKNGILKVDLHADTASTQPNASKIDLKGVRLAFFDPTGKPSGNLTSRTGEYDMGTSAMIARGDVVLILKQPQGDRTIKSEELYYDQRGDKVWSDKATTMIEDGQTYHGTSFTSNTSFTNLTVHNLTTSGISTNSKKPGLSF
jgi:LPS export ABC transporter protein LptC